MSKISVSNPSRTLTHREMAQEKTDSISRHASVLITRFSSSGFRVSSASALASPVPYRALTERRVSRSFSGRVLRESSEESAIWIRASMTQDALNQTCSVQQSQRAVREYGKAVSYIVCCG